MYGSRTADNKIGRRHTKIHIIYVFADPYLRAERQVNASRFDVFYKAVQGASAGAVEVIKLLTSGRAFP